MQLIEECEALDAGVNLALVRFTPTGLAFDPSIGYEEWVRVGVLLHGIQRSVHWWIGDWLNFGERKYGEMYAQAEAATGFDYQTLANDKWIASRIESSRRRESLPFSHHAIVASMKASAQDVLLTIAETDALTGKELRALVKEEKKALGGIEREPYQVALVFTAFGHELRIMFDLDETLQVRNVEIERV